MALARVYLVAGELSGDLLGAGLMRALRARHPDVEFRGIGGPNMQREGMQSRFPLETLSVMGLVEVVKHLPELVRVRRTLYEEALAWQPDIMIGIDAPDFNTGLELKLRQAGIKTAHYVSPSVWAWRQGRVKKIARAVDAMLTFLPFEADFYKRHQVPVAFVGHPLADEMALHNDRRAARQELGLPQEAPVLAVLPGSRGNEIRFMGRTFLDAVTRLVERYPALCVVIPAATEQRHQELTALLSDYPELAEHITLTQGNAREAMVASTAVLLTSGTAALEAMLCHRAMLVAYKMAPATHWLAKRLVKTRWISLPNLIAQDALVPELVQEAASEEAIFETLNTLLEDVPARQALEKRFAQMHAELQRGASERAALAVEAVARGLALPEESEESHGQNV
ncbi:lipid-A-disaccharide synthase [Vreelandella sp. EE22]